MNKDTPWWYSAGEESAGEESAREAPTDDSESKPIDVWAILGSVQRLATWAQNITAEQVLAPHAEHGDPALHPTCVLCRTTSVLADVRGFRAGAPSGEQGNIAQSRPSVGTVESINWLVVHRGSCKR